MLDGSNQDVRNQWFNLWKIRNDRCVFLKRIQSTSIEFHSGFRILFTARWITCNLFIKQIWKRYWLQIKDQSFLWRKTWLYLSTSVKLYSGGWQNTSQPTSYASRKQHHTVIFLFGLDYSGKWGSLNVESACETATCLCDLLPAAV